MNTTFCLWEYTGVDSIYDVGKLVKDLTTYVKTQTNSQSEVILDMYPEGYSLHHNGVWNIVEAVCEACDVHTASITLVIGDMTADYPCNVIIHQPRWLMETAAEFMDFKQDFSKVAEKKFLHFIGRATWDRVGVNKFLREKYADDSWCTIAQTKHRRRVIDDTFHGLTNNHFNPDQIVDMMQYTLDPPKNFLVQTTREDYTTFPDNMLPLQHMYTNAFVEIVHETDIHDNNFFITEKTIRPILFKKPFISMCGKHFLKNLRTLGFKTFDDWFDERYDEVDTRQRYDAVLKRIINIGKMSYKELSAWNLEMQETVEHNFNHLLSRGWLEHLDKFDVQFWHDGKGQLL